MVVTPSSPNAECDRSQGFLLLAVKNTLVRITLRKGNNILCPYGILRINSGCRPSHFPLAKARTGISGGFLIKHRLHSLHKGACSSPVHMRFVTRRLCKSIWTLSPVCNRTVGQDLKTSSDGTSGQVVIANKLYLLSETQSSHQQWKSGWVPLTNVFQHTLHMRQIAGVPISHLAANPSPDSACHACA